MQQVTAIDFDPRHVVAGTVSPRSAACSNIGPDVTRSGRQQVNANHTVGSDATRHVLSRLQLPTSARAHPFRAQLTGVPVHQHLTGIRRPTRNCATHDQRTPVTPQELSYNWLIVEAVMWSRRTVASKISSATTATNAVILIGIHDARIIIA